VGGSTVAHMRVSSATSGKSRSNVAAHDIRCADARAVSATQSSAILRGRHHSSMGLSGGSAKVCSRARMEPACAAIGLLTGAASGGPDSIQALTRQLCSWIDSTTAPEMLRTGRGSSKPTSAAASCKRTSVSALATISSIPNQWLGLG
jgi:hypothetical protein